MLWSWEIVVSQLSQKSKEGHFVHLYLMPKIGKMPHPVHVVSCVTPLTSNFGYTSFIWFWIFLVKQGIRLSTLSSTNFAIFYSIFLFQCSFHLQAFSTCGNSTFSSSNFLSELRGTGSFEDWISYFGSSLSTKSSELSIVLLNNFCSEGSASLI